MTVISVFLTAAALIGFFFADSFPVLAVFAVPYGLGAGAVDAALNNYVALRYPSGHMSWLHCLWGAGAIAGPFIMGHAISTSTWHFGYLAVGLVQTAIGLLLLVTLPVWKANGADGEKRRKSIGLKAALKIKGVPQILIGFFAYSAAEATAMNWASTYFVEAKGLTAEQAAQFAALFYMGITAGRFLSGFVTGRLGDRRTIVIGTCVLSCGIIAIAVPVGVPALSAAGFVVAGLGCAHEQPPAAQSGDILVAYFSNTGNTERKRLPKKRAVRCTRSFQKRLTPPPISIIRTAAAALAVSRTTPTPAPRSQASRKISMTAPRFSSATPSGGATRRA